MLGENIAINPHNNDISDLPLIKQIRYFTKLIENWNGVKLTKAGNIPPVIVKELYAQGFIKDYMIEHGITKLTKETDCNAIVLTRILCELSGLIKKRNGVLTITKKAFNIVDTNALFSEVFSTFAEKFSWAYFDGYQNELIGQFGYGYSLFLLNRFGDIPRNSRFYAEKYFELFPQLLTEQSYDGSNEASYNCYSVRTFDRFLNYFGFIQTTEIKMQNFDIQKTELFDKFICCM